MSNQNNTLPPPEAELKFQIQVMTHILERMNFVMGIGLINVATMLGTSTQDREATMIGRR
jgi:hypothetical protein